MANRYYRSFKHWLGTGGQFNPLTDDIRFVLIDTADYAANTDIGGDEFLADIPAAARVATTAALTGKTWVDGTFDAEDTPLPDIGGDEAEAGALYIHTGNDATARLIMYIDTAGGLPVMRDTVEDMIRWHANGIFKL